MPLYEYQCQNCGHRFERIQKFSDAPIAECPKCGGAVQKLVSSPAFQFKGTGWYVTDYARQGEKSTESKPAAKSDSTTESKTTTPDTKPAKDAAESKPSTSKPSKSDSSTTKS
jgi:putative FmdB family regulatory protein